MEEKKDRTVRGDVFDRLMACRALAFARPFYQKHKEIFLYLLFGVGTTFVNLLVFHAFTAWIVLDVLVANVLAWLAAVLSAYVTNRTWVFTSRARGIRAVLGEILAFFGGRVFTLLFEEAMLWFFIKRLGLHTMAVKLVVAVVIVILNYVISKLLVFRKKQ